MCMRARRAHYVALPILALSSTLAGCGFARAGAFLQEEGKTQIIVTSTFDGSDHTFDASGKLLPLAQYRKFEMVTYAEYGATDWLTLIFAPSSSQSTGSVGVASARGAAGSVDLVETADRYARIEAGGRFRVWRNDHSIVSFQATFRAPYAVNRSLPPGLRREVNEFDARALYGYSFEFWERNGFISAEFGYRLRAGAADEWRADFTLGYRVMPQLLLLAQNFNSFARAAAPAPNLRSHKLQVSAVYDLTGTWSIQGGVYATVLGVNVRRERGVLGGLWRKF